MFKFPVLNLVVFAIFAFPTQKRTCDHPAPPEGMHYVCDPQNSCDCRLEKDRAETAVASAGSATPTAELCSSSDLKYFVAPAYPAAARRARKQGTVTAQLAVDTSGTATVKIESGDAAFAEQVMSALKKWRFAPAASPKALTAIFTFALAGDPTENVVTTVSGSSPLNLVIAATPPVR
jgi:TonB family protein